MTFADLRALHAIIGAAIDDIERIYRPSTHHRTSQSSSSSCFHNSSSSAFPARSSSKPRSSVSTDSDIEEEDDDDANMPLTPVSVSNSQAEPNSVRFASTGRKLKGRERSYTIGSLPQPPFSPSGGNVNLPPPILKQPLLDFPDLDTPIPVTPATITSASMDKASSPNPSSSPQILVSPTLTVELDNVGAGASMLLDPTQRQREWRKKCEDLTIHPEVIKAANRIVAACGQMSAMVQKPFLTVCDAAMGYNLPACMRFLEAAHIVEMLREAGPRGLSSKEIAEKIETQLGIGVDGDESEKNEKKAVDPTRISHILRLLATHHITREVRPDVFANNRVSSVVDSGKSWQELADMRQSNPERKYEGTDGIAAFVGLCTDELFKASAYLADCYLFPPRTPTSTPSSSPKSPVPTSNSGSPQLPVPSAPFAAVPPRPQLSISAPVGNVTHLGMVTPNDSTSSLGSVIEEESPKTEVGDSPMRFAQNPHPTPTRKRDRTRSSGRNVSIDTPRGPSTPPTPQSLPNVQKKPGILKRWSSRSFSRTPTSSTAPADVPPLSPMPGTPRSAFSETFETPRSRVSSTTSLISQRPAIPVSPDTPRSPAAPSQANTFGDLLETPKSTPRHAKTPSHDLHMLNTPQSTPSRQSCHSESNAVRTTPRWTPSTESLRSLGTKSSFASLKTGKRSAEPLPQTYAELLDAVGHGNGSLGPAFDLRPPGLVASPRLRTFPGTAASPLSRKDDPLPPIPPLHASPTPPALPPKSPLRTPPGTHSSSPHPAEPCNAGKGVGRKGAGKGEGKQGLRPGDEMYAPFNVAFGTRLRYFEWLERGENVFRLRRFGKAMTGTEKWEVPGSIVGGFPWHELPPRSVVVDVGGGIGSTSMLLANAFPHLRFVIQDRPPVVEMGTAAWRSRYPELLDSGRATFQAHDFFKPQPPLPPTALPGTSEAKASAAGGSSDVKPAVFLMRVITHDWPDSYVTRILLRLRLAAGPKTRLVLADYVLPLACVDEDEDIEPETPETPDANESLKKITHEPSPGTVRTLAPEGSSLLPNLGKANANAYWLDLTMQVMFNAQERTLRELAALARSAGWKIVHVTRAEGSLFGHLVAVPVDIPEEMLALADEAESEEACGPDEGDVTSDALPTSDTFLSSVELPSETAIRAGVATGSIRLNAARGDSGSSYPKQRRARAYTFTGRGSQDKEGKEGKAGEVRKGFRTIMKMLSKAHLKGDASEVDVGTEGEGEGRLALSRTRTRV